VAFLPAGFGGLEAAFRGHPLFPFDAVLCLGNSLPHLLTPQALSAALADFAACLCPGGRLILQNRNFDAVLARRARWMEPQAHNEGRREWLFVRFYDFDPDSLITFHILTLARADGGPWQQRETATRLRPQTQAGLLEALEPAGFGPMESFGGLDGSPFDPASSGNLVVVANRKL
jgi:glycine/sarcosine N-methyltransferase